MVLQAIQSHSRSRILESVERRQGTKYYYRHRVILYADDCQLYLSTPVSGAAAAVNILSTYLTEVNAWLSRSRLRLNASKTHVMWLGSSQLLDKIDIHEVPVTSARVTVSDTARDLGVVIDSRLTMANYVAAVCRSCYYQLWQLRSVARSLSVEAVKAVVHAFISSHLDYCNSLLTGVNDGLLRDYSPCRMPPHA